MSVNPALVYTSANELCPAPFPNEVFVLRREGVQCELHGVQTRVKGWQARGALYMSNIRLVFVAATADDSGKSVALSAILQHKAIKLWDLMQHEVQQIPL